MLRKGHLSDLFVGVVVKKMTLVETVSEKSNQHEFQGTRALRSLFGDADRRGLSTRFIWLADEQSAITADGFVSWSNVRKGKPRAAEFHLYYSGNAVTEAMRPGDSVFIALRQDSSALVLIAPAGSTMYAQLLWLFGLPDNDGGEFLYRDINHGSSAELNFAARYILDELGIEPAEQDVDVLDNLLAPFGLNFPTTRVFSALARSCLPEISADANADTALMAWLEQEERLFRRLERRVVTQRLQEGFFRMANQRWISSSHSR